MKSLYKTLVVAAHTGHQALREPLFWILTAVFGAMIWSSQFFIMFTLDDAAEGRLLRNMGVSSVALCGALLAVLLSWLVITRDMERLVALTVLSKPVARSQFLVGKYLGILGAVVFSSTILAGILLATVWQKETGPLLQELSEVDGITNHEGSGDAIVQVDSVEPKPADGAPYRAIVTFAKRIPEGNAPFAGLTHLPEGGRFAQGQLVVWDNQNLRQWLVLRSWNEGDHGKAEVALFQAWRGPGGAPVEQLTSPILALGELPTAGLEGRLAPSRHGHAQRLWAEFWTSTAPQVAASCVLAVLSVAVLLAFTASFAPHVPLVANAAVSFLVFLGGNVANDVFRALTEPSRPRALRIVGEIFYAIFPNLENYRVESLLSFGREISPSYVFWSAGYGIAYAALVLVAGAAFFSRKEIR